MKDMIFIDGDFDESWYEMKIKRKRHPKVNKDKKVEPINCNHKNNGLGYIQWHLWAEDLIKKGIRQEQCPICKLWLFPEEI